MSDHKFTPPTFGKFAKKAKDLFKKKYDFENKIVTKHKTKTAGLTLEASGVVTTPIAGAFKGKYKEKKYGEFEAEVSTAGKLYGTVKLDQLAKGVEVNVSGGVDPSAKKKGVNDKLSAEYSQEYFAATGSADVNFGDATTAVLDGTASVGFEGLSVGAQFSYDVSQSQQKFADFNLGAEYTRDDVTLSLTTEKKGDVIHGFYHQQINRNYQVGAQFDYVPRAEVVSKKHVLTLGTEYQLDVDTVVKAKANSNGLIETAIQHNLQNPSVQVGLAASFNRKSAECLQAQSFGVTITCGDY